MWGWRSARAKAKAWEAARASAEQAAEKQSWPPPALPPTAPPHVATPQMPRPPRGAAPPPVPVAVPPAPPTPRRMQYDGPSAPVSAPLYGRWVDTPADAPSEPPSKPPVETPVETPIEAPAEMRAEPPATPVAAIPIAEPEAEDAEPVVTVAAQTEAPAAAATEPPVETPKAAAEAAVTTLRLVPSTDAPSPVPTAGPQPETQAEFLRLLEVVTSMCDHVIEYIEADRAERRMMIETLGQLSRTITDGTRGTLAAAPSTPRSAPTELFEARERLVGGSMPSGPERDIDLRGPEPGPEPQLQPVLTDASPLPTAISTEIAVEVRGRFGDRWVDGFEICEVMSTPDGPRYRLRRQRDGVVLPELFDATSIRHIETFEQLNGEQLNGPPGYWSRS